jgi:hypothetical protein
VTRPRWVHAIDSLDASLIIVMDSEKTDAESQPAAKKRKLAAAGSFGNFGSQAVQSSFTEVLERLKEESGGGTISELYEQIGIQNKVLRSV